MTFDVSQNAKILREYRPGDLVPVPRKNKVDMSLLYPETLLSRYVSDDGVTQPHLWRIMYVGDNLPREGDRFVSTSPWEHV